MKEYEYIVFAIDELFSHLISSTICLENYHDVSMGNAFRHCFSMFNSLRNEYEKNEKIRDGNDEEEIEVAKYKAKCRGTREQILEKYILELQGIDSSIDFKNEAKQFYEKLEKEDEITLEMQLMIYPYLLTLIRNREESRES